MQHELKSEKMSSVDHVAEAERWETYADLLLEAAEEALWPFLDLILVDIDIKDAWG